RSSHQFQRSASPPPGFTTRCSSGTARSRSNQWKAWPAKAASTLSAGSGIASAGASCASASGTASRSWSSIAPPGSTAVASKPAATRARVSFPVPAPTSKPRARAARSDTRGGAEIHENAILAARAARVAHPAPVPDHQMREASPVGARHEPDEIALDLDRILLLRQPEPLREPAHMRVDDDPLRLPELGRDDVRRLAGNTRQADQLLEPRRNLTVELLEQQP